MKKKRIILGVVVMLGMALLPLPSKAVLQANPNGTKKQSPIDWLTSIRDMEKHNQAMGLEETINSTTLKATSESNRIDVHMIKSTEWGGVAILSTSGYGNSKKMQDSTLKTTTGNKSGVYFPLTWEWVAGATGNHQRFTNIDAKYYDDYSNKASKAGDALGSANIKNPRLRRMA